MTTYALRLDDDELARYRGMAERARRTEAELWRRAGIVPGARVVDVGCGPGAMLAVLAAEVAPTGVVVGVDADPAAVSAAELLLEEVPNAAVRTGEAPDTDLPLGTFDVAVLRHVLAHNGGQEQAIVDSLAELVRPGGRVLVVDVDLTAARTEPTSVVLDEACDRYVELHRSLGNDPRAGLRLKGRAEAAGLEVLSYTGSYAITPFTDGGPAWAAREAMLAAGLVTVEQLRRWGAAMAALTSSGSVPLTFVPTFALVARRPA